MKKEIMFEAFKALDSKLSSPLTILVGGGSAMLLAHGVPLSTHDVDGLPIDSSLSPSELDILVKQVASELGISAHWYNDYFNSFTYTIPKDFRSRLIEVFKGTQLKVMALGLEDLLIMKCFAGREKDIGHARALVKKGANTTLVLDHIEALAKKNIPRAKEALEFLEDIIEETDA